MTENGVDRFVPVRFLPFICSIPCIAIFIAICQFFNTKLAFRQLKRKLLAAKTHLVVSHEIVRFNLHHSLSHSLQITGGHESYDLLKKKFWHFSTTNATFLISRAKIVGTRKQQKRLRLHNCDSIFDGSITARGIMVLVPDIAIYRAHNIKMSHILGIIEAVGKKNFPYPFSHGVSISIEKLGQHGGKNKS